jgi:DNA-binding response OmpR family regulator
VPEGRILLIEDDPDTARILEHVLIDSGYFVDRAPTAAEAYARLSEYTYSLVIADLRLPDGNGMDVADHAAELGAKIAIISGYVHQLTREAAERHEIMAKPMRPVELIHGGSTAHRMRALAAPTALCRRCPMPAIIAD